MRGGKAKAPPPSHVWLFSSDGVSAGRRGTTEVYAGGARSGKAKAPRAAGRAGGAGKPAGKGRRAFKTKSSHKRR